MIRHIFSNSIIPYIYDHETKLTNTYMSLIDRYQSKFKNYSCHVIAERYWYNSSNNTTSLERIPFCYGYTCAFSCSIERAGKLVCIDEIEGNMLTTSWTISYLGKAWSIKSLKKSPLIISMFDDIEEAVSDLDEFLRLLDSMKAI